MLLHYVDLIGHNQATVVWLLHNAFNAVATIRAPFPATIDTVLVGNPDITLMGPHEDVDLSS